MTAQNLVFVEIELNIKRIKNKTMTFKLNGNILKRTNNKAVNSTEIPNIISNFFILKS